MTARRVEQITLPSWLEPREAFARAFGDATTAVWLDAAADNGWSIMADDRGPDAFAITARLDSPLPDRARAEAETVWEAVGETMRQFVGLRGELDRLPGPFRLGWVGWLGYEFGAVSMGERAGRSAVPDAALLFADRALVFDHANRAVTAIGLSSTPGDLAAWVGELQRRFNHHPSPQPTAPRREQPAAWRHDRAAYLAKIEHVRAAIRRGDAYQVCLTNELTAPFDGDPLEAYLTLRELAPTPRSAYVRAGGASLLCVSPEQFLTVDAQGTVRARPMKGTRPRAGDAPDEAARRRLAADPKERAENLMIVDLLRNDLSRVVDPATLRVERLFDVETYRHVHQLVSTVTGRLDGADALAAVRAAFPGGSMTGAPKASAMRLIRDLEQGPRGVYAGAVGYLGLDGACDLAMVIRSAVVSDSTLTYGTGGGITIDSDPQREWEELAHKARPALAALGYAFPDDSDDVSLTVP